PRDAVVLLALAEHYDQYAYTGLLDAEREHVNRDMALEYYNRYLEFNSQDVNVRARIGRIYMRNKQYDEAAAWFRKCIDVGYKSESIQQWYMEALFASNRYG